MFYCLTGTFNQDTRKSGEYRGRRPEVRQTFCCKGFVEGQSINDVVLYTGCSPNSIF